VILCLLTMGVRGQIITGQVLSLPDSLPVPYATLTNQKYSWGINAGEDGTFVINYSKEREQDTLSISSMGFNEARIPYHDLYDGIKVYLKIRPVQLDEVIIRNNVQITDLWLGSKQNSSVSNICPRGEESIQEVALFIPNTGNYQGYIAKVGYYIGDLGKAKTPFRVRIYKNENGIPGKDLLKENVVIHGNKRNAWRDVELKKYNIPLPVDGFFVSMEWIVVPDKKYYVTRKWNDGRVTSEFGQCAGSTYEFGPGYEKIRNNGGQWESYPYRTRNNPRPMFRAQVRVYE
ncbi:MAG: carboxypeptidase-like regulatory domain-containing protein, partial [Bacteroidetes bacterium]|nr:carboxypeptidase-like regulatory domain-containing protein [Bacteroidota bacterium]